MKFKKLALLVLCFLCFITSNILAFAAEEKWSSEVTGEVFIEGNLTIDEAQSLCRNRAKAKAIEEVAGVSLLREMFVVDYIKVADFIRGQTNAWVKEVKDERWDDPISVRKAANSPPVPKLRVHLKALVLVDKEVQRDFSVKLKLNESIFRNGDEMIITVKSSHDCYLTVLNILSDEKVTVLIPSKYQGNRFVKKGVPYVLPDKETMSKQRILKMYNTTGTPTVREAILVLATKNDVDLIEGDFVTGDMREYSKPTGLFRDLLEKMMDIAPRDRAMDMQYYEIKSSRTSLN